MLLVAAGVRVPFPGAEGPGMPPDHQIRWLPPLDWPSGAPSSQPIWPWRTGGTPLQRPVCAGASPGWGGCSFWSPSRAWGSFGLGGVGQGEAGDPERSPRRRLGIGEVWLWEGG